jgi:hypothetical protein
MGSTSKELKEIKKRAVKKTVDPRYYLVRVKAGEVAPSGWLARARTKTYFTPARIEDYLNIFREAGKAQHVYVGSWYMYPGMKPDKKWGPVCP